MGGLRLQGELPIFFWKAQRVYTLLTITQKLRTHPSRERHGLD